MASAIKLFSQINSFYKGKKYKYTTANNLVYSHTFDSYHLTAYIMPVLMGLAFDHSLSPVSGGFNRANL